jgi:GT2 family glycosyltransferase/thioredoxin-like negative regulator of GroEL
MSPPEHAAEPAWERSAEYVAEPLLSAIVFVYGAERFMRGLLEDLCAQTIAPRMEILVADTGSPTNEGAIVREFMAKYPNIAYLRTEERESTCAAANRCIAAARGRYLTLACADDRHRRDALERLVAALEADPGAILAHADVAVTDTENETFDSAHVVGHFRWPDFDARRLFQVCTVGPQPVYRRELHERYGGYDPAFVTAGDYEMWLRAVARGERFVHVPEVLGLYLRSPSSNEHANQALSIAESEKARIMHWPEAWGIRPPAAGCYFVPAAPPPTAAPQPARSLAVRPAGVAARDPGEPLVSVVMPTFERREWLERAVKSVLAQTYRNVELIVVNDGGAPVDDLLRALDARRQITSVRLARNRNRSAARNAGLALARGTYVAYLDDDDWYLPRHIELLVRRLEEDGGAVAYSFAQRVHEERRGNEWVQSTPEPIYVLPYEPTRLLVGNFIPLPCLMHRRDLIDEVGGFDEELGTHEDWDLLIRFAERHPFAQVLEATCCFSWRDDGSSTTSRARADFVRTMDVIHARYARLAAGLPGIAEAQRRARAALARQPVDDRPECSIVIPLYNRAELTRQCLTELARVTNDVRFEVVLVDNGSSDGTAALLAELSGDVQIIRNEHNLGFARACNQGARAARGRHLVFLNNDTIPLRGWLRALVDRVEAEPDVAIVGSKLLYPDGTLQHAGVVFDHAGQPYHLFAGLPGDFPPANRRRDLQAVTAACMLVRREAFLDVSGFDEGFRNSFEDVDLCIRIGARGSRVVYEPASVLFHLESQSPGRRDHDAANGARLRERWAARSLADEAGVLLDHGFVVRTTCADGATRRILDRVRDDERAAWARVAEVERRAREAGFADVVELLADAGAWPADAGVLHWAARLCSQAGVPHHAPALWRRLLALEENRDARAALATEALERRDVASAREHVAALLGRAPEDAQGWLVRGVVDLQSNAHAEAADAFARAETLGADRRKARLGRAMAQLAGGRSTDAWSLLAEIVVEHPDDPEALHWLLRAGCALERWAALRPILAAYVERNPDDAAIRFALAGVHVRLAELDAARTQYERLRASAPQLDGLATLAQAIGA